MFKTSKVFFCGLSLIVVGALAGPAAAADTCATEPFAALVFLPITPKMGCTYSSSGSCSGGLSSDSGEYAQGVEDLRSLWEDNTALVDGADFTERGVLTAGHFNNAKFQFQPGHFYIIDTNVVPDHGNLFADPFTLARDHSIFAHWSLIRAWTEKAAKDVKNLALVGHSFSGPGVVFTAATVDTSVAHQIKTVTTVTSPNAGLGLANFCDLYAEAACDLQPDSNAMNLLRLLAQSAVLDDEVRLGDKLIAVAAELVATDNDGQTQFLGNDGFIPIESQLFLSPDHTALRENFGWAPGEQAYRAAFYELISSATTPNYHVQANTGPGMQAAAAFIANPPCDLGFEDPVYQKDPFEGVKIIEPLPCSALHPCGAGEGNCNSDADCEAGLQCLSVGILNPGYAYCWAGI